MTTRRYLIAALLILGGCKSNPRQEPFKMGDVIEALKPCPEEATTAALQKLSPVLGHFDETSARSLDAADKAIACYRLWASLIADTCQQNAVEGWLDYYEGKIRRSRETLAERKPVESDYERVAREYQEKQARAREWERKNPFPKLPQCESKP